MEKRETNDASHPVLGTHWTCSVCGLKKMCLVVTDGIFTCRVCRIRKLQKKAMIDTQEHPVLGGYWKCAFCYLLIEDELSVCPECNAKKTKNENIDKRLFMEASELTISEHEEMISDNGFK